MESKKILITGGNGGLGSSVADELSSKGCEIYILDLKPRETMLPANCRYIQADITDEVSLLKAKNELLELTDSLDVIINAAGIMFMGSAIEESAEWMKKTLDVNVTGMFRVNKTFFPFIEKTKGRIINFSSEYGKYCSLPFNSFYTASKHAVEAYSGCLRRELAYLGIKVITIRPGAFKTEMTASTDKCFEDLLSSTVHYAETYRKLKPLMTNETKKAKDPSLLGKLVSKAALSKKPKKTYKINHNFAVKLLSLLPDGIADWIFLSVLG